MAKASKPIKAVIFCGGVGTRMWPMSQDSTPKQFQELVGSISMFQSTFVRLAKSFSPSDIFVSTGLEYVELVHKQAPDIPRENIISEPVRRDTLGAVGLVNAVINKRYPDAIIAAVWGADHIVKDEKEFNLAIQKAAEYAIGQDKIVKIDVRPTFPSIHNGWVKLGHLVTHIDKFNIYSFEKFIEKPNKENAERLFKSREYLINTGYLVWPTTLMNSLYKQYQPETYSILDKIVSGNGAIKDDLLSKLYPSIPKISVDYGIFEKFDSKNTVVMPVDIGWVDVGTWELLYEGLVDNPDVDNLIKGNVETINTERAVVYSNNPNKLIGVIGVRDLVVVDTAEGLLICDLHHTDDVKQLVDILKQKHLNRYI